MKIIYVLISIKKKLLLYSFKKLDNWIRVVTIVLVALLFFNSIQSSSFIVQFIKTQFNANSTYFYPLFNILLFVFFISNILSTYFLSGSKFSQILFKTLLHYPISFKKIILYEIISGLGEIFNLLFIPFYIAAYFIAGNSFSLINFVPFIFILILFLFCISSIIALIKSISSLLVSLKKFKIIISFLAIVATVVILLIIKELPLLVLSKENIIQLNNYFNFSPSEILANYIFAIKSGSNFGNFIITFSYFFIVNILLFSINIKLLKRLKKNYYFPKVLSISNNKFSISTLIERLVKNPITKKDTIYFFRSPRGLINQALFIWTYLSLLYLFLTQSMSSTELAQGLILIQTLFFIFHTIIIIKYGGNIFGYDYRGVINYFIRPITYTTLLRSKNNYYNYLLLINFLFTSIYLFILGIHITDYVFYISFLTITFFVLRIGSSFLSIYFPKRIDFYKLGGFNISFVTTFVALFLLLVLGGLSNLLFSMTSLSHKIFLIFIFMFLGLLTYYFRNKITHSLCKILLNQKERIISECR